MHHAQVKGKVGRLTKGLDGGQKAAVLEPPGDGVEAVHERRGRGGRGGGFRGGNLGGAPAPGYPRVHHWGN